MPTSPATIPAAIRNEGSLTSSALEQRASRCRGRAHGEPANRSAEGGHPHNGPLRPPGARDSGRGPGRVERQNQRDHPQPGRWRIIAGAGRDSPSSTLARLDDRDGSQQCGQLVLLVVHPGLPVAEPGALHPLRPGSVRGVGAIGLRPHGQPGDAGGALGDGLLQVGQSGLLPRGQPPPREGLADHAVGAATGHIAAVPTRPTAHIAGLSIGPGRRRAPPGGARSPPRPR